MHTVYQTVNSVFFVLYYCKECHEHQLGVIEKIEFVKILQIVSHFLWQNNIYICFICIVGVASFSSSLNFMLASEVIPAGIRSVAYISSV